MKLKIALLLMLVLVAGLFLFRGSTTLATVEGTVIDQERVDQELRARFQDRVLSDLIAWEMLRAEARRKEVELREEEVERRLAEQLAAPETRAAIDQGTITLTEVRANLERLVLLDDLICHEVETSTLETYFKLNAQSLVRARLRHLVLASEEDATELKYRILNLEDFVEQARQHSSDPITKEQGGDLGWLTRPQVPPALLDVFDQAKPGEVAGPVKGPYGYHLVMVEERQDTFEPLLEHTREAYAAEQRGRYLKQLRSRSKIEVKGLTEEGSAD